MKHWSLHFTRHFNDWELEIVETFFSMLRESLVKRDDSNKGVWKDDKKGLFSIKSFYEVLDVGGQSSFQRTLFGICGYHPKLVLLHGNLLGKSSNFR